ncbi:peptidase inhibitor 16-like, partial [Clarias magur]
MICRTALHYALFWLILASASAQLTEDQKKLIVDLHNNYRATVDPQPANMQRMLWDNAVSQVAENFAARCIWDHNPNVIGVLGESLFMTLGPLTLNFTVGLWHSERQNYDFYTDSCTPGKLCGDYTQMVWANTTFIGCAAQFCPNVFNFDAQNATVLVCNYYPPGNIKGQLPYQVGLPCSSCPNSTIGCLSNSC